MTDNFVQVVCEYCNLKYGVHIDWLNGSLPEPLNSYIFNPARFCCVGCNDAHKRIYDIAPEI